MQVSLLKEIEKDVIQEDREYYTQENREYFEDEEEVFNSPKDKKFVEQLRKALPGSDAEKFGNSLDELIEEQQVKEAFFKLTDHPKERNYTCSFKTCINRYP